MLFFVIEKFIKRMLKVWYNRSEGIKERGKGMKKIVFGLILGSALVSFNGALALAEESQTQESAAIEQVEKNQTNLVTKEMINIGGEGKLKVEEKELKGKELEFVPFKNEGIELKADGTYVGLKSGKFTFTPYYVIKEEANTKNASSKMAFPEVAVEVKDKRQVFYEVKSDYELDKASYLVGETGHITRKPVNKIEMKGEFKPVKTPYFELAKDSSFKNLKAGKEKLDFEFILSEETEKNLKEDYIKNAKEELTLDDITIVDGNKTSSLTIEVKEKEVPGEKVTLEVVKAYTINTSTIKVGESAQISIKPLNGVNLSGEYKTIDNANVSMDKDGRVVAKKEGKIDIQPELMLSEDSKKVVKEQYIKDSGRDDLKLEDITIVEKNQNDPIAIQVNKKEEPKAEKLSIDVTPSFSLNKQSFQVGETGGKLTVNPLHGIQVKGKFKEVTNPVINFKSDGSFIGMQAGSVELAPTFEIAPESLEEIATVFLKKSENAHLTRKDVEFTHKDVQPVFPIKFTSPSGNNNNNNSGGKSAKNYVPVEEKRILPQTGENRSWAISLIGGLSILGSSLLFRSKR